MSMSKSDASERERPVSVGLVQINNSFAGQEYLPYSIACLRAYMDAHASASARYQFLPLIYKRLPIREIVSRLLSADVVGFSTYIWNANISLEVARRLKELRPDIVVVFGGPQVPDKPEAFLRTHSFIDVVVHNEGEKTFLELLERLPDCNWEGLAGVSYLTADGAFRKEPPRPRMKDLAELPSPFLNGMFDQLMAQNPEEKWIGLWETNRGCPFQCTFCDWGSATAAKVSRFELHRLFEELDWFVDHKIQYITVCDANFGSLKRDVEIAQYVADLRKRTGFPKGFSVQGTKNAPDRAFRTQMILADVGLNMGVGLSMQSMDPVTLKNIKRDNISLDAFLELSNRFRMEKVGTYSDIIIGLPGETHDSFVRGVDTLINSGQHNRIQFANLSILPNAEMADPDYQAKYGMVTVFTEIINNHGKKEKLIDDVQEIQELVVETSSMGADDWCRTRAISWMIAFLYFDKIVQIPIVLLHELSGVSFREMFERFMSVDEKDFPVIGEIRDFFLAEARSIQTGGVEYVYSEEWLGIYWPADEYIFIRLTAERRFDAFYAEVERLFEEFLNTSERRDVTEAIHEAIAINHALVIQPGVDTDISLRLGHNIIDYWTCVCSGQTTLLKKGDYSYEISRSGRSFSDVQAWCREVVWWGHKNAAYLYPVTDTAAMGLHQDVSAISGEDIDIHASAKSSSQSG